MRLVFLLSRPLRTLVSSATSATSATSLHDCYLSLLDAVLEMSSSAERSSSSLEKYVDLIMIDLESLPTALLEAMMNRSGQTHSYISFVILQLLLLVQV
jgi:hypothetical protein